MAEVLVTLQEIAAATGRKADKVREECSALGLHVREDWAGRPAVSVDDARGLASGTTRRAREHADEQARVKAACKQWVADRTAAAMAGADAAEEKVKRGGGPYVGLVFVDSAEEGSSLASAVGALRGPAKVQAPAREVA